MKARRGDLIVIRQEVSSYVVGKGSEVSVETRVFVVSGITRDGVARTVRSLDLGQTVQPIDRMIRVHGTWLVPAAEMDVAAAKDAVRAHCWPGHENMIQPWYGEDGPREVARLLAPFRRST